MIKSLPASKSPQWLVNAALNPDAAKFNLSNLVKDSLFYPACGFNGTPVKYFSGNIHSFIYADYGVAKSEFLNNLDGRTPDGGFKHYHAVLRLDIQQHEILAGGQNFQFQPQAHRASWMEGLADPMGHWSIWVRNDDADPSVGAKQFSFLYLFLEMSIAYQALYYLRQKAPKIITIIQPGGGFGGGWENADADDSFFKMVVESHPACVHPKYLLYGGYGFSNFYDRACWSEYRGNRIEQLPERWAGLWKRNTSRISDWRQHTVMRTESWSEE